MRLLSAILLAAILSSPGPALAQAAKQALAPAAVQKEFGDFIAKFRAALKADDTAAIAAMAQLPFQGDAAVSDAAQFRAKVYKAFFTAKNRACLLGGKPDYARDGDNNDTYDMFCGQIGFTFTKTPAGFLLTDIGPND